MKQISKRHLHLDKFIKLFPNSLAMTLHQFSVLTENEKTAIVCNEEAFVGNREENNFSILLYEVRSF